MKLTLAITKKGVQNQKSEVKLLSFSQRMNESNNER